MDKARREPETLGDYVLSIIRRHGDVSMREASRRAGLNENAIQQIANGDRPHPRHDTLKAIADTWGTEHDYFEMCRLAGYPTPIPPGVDEDEIKLLTMFRALPEEGQKQLLETVASLHGGKDKGILPIALRAGELDERGQRTILEMIDYVQKAQTEPQESEPEAEGSASSS
jgi:transcriptional regulator with XRE-family HTH domain